MDMGSLSMMLQNYPALQPLIQKYMGMMPQNTQAQPSFPQPMPIQQMPVQSAQQSYVPFGMMPPISQTMSTRTPTPTFKSANPMGTGGLGMYSSGGGSYGSIGGGVGGTPTGTTGGSSGGSNIYMPGVQDDYNPYVFGNPYDYVSG